MGQVASEVSGSDSTLGEGINGRTNNSFGPDLSELVNQLVH